MFVLLLHWARSVWKAWPDRGLTGRFPAWPRPGQAQNLEEPMEALLPQAQESWVRFFKKNFCSSFAHAVFSFSFLFSLHYYFLVPFLFHLFSLRFYHYFISCFIFSVSFFLLPLFFSVFGSLLLSFPCSITGHHTPPHIFIKLPDCLYQQKWSVAQLQEGSRLGWDNGPSSQRCQL